MKEYLLEDTTCKYRKLIENQLTSKGGRGNENSKAKC